MWFSLALVFAQVSAQVPAGDADAGTPGNLSLHGALEAEALVMPSGPTDGQYDGFITLRPLFGFNVGDDFQAEVGPTFRFRLIDSPPDQRAEDFGSVLRRRDWDQPSDFGQLISVLRIAPDSSPFYVRVGPVRKRTLGLGHLINRYSNQENPDYHPASANVVLALGPVRAEFFASDLFGARVFAGELAWDLGRTFSPNADAFDRYVLALQLAHDAAVAGQPPDGTLDFTSAQRLTLLQLDGSVVIVRNQSLRFMALVGAGSRFDTRSNLGFLLGLALDATVKEIAFSVKLEARKVAGGFRQGLIGPSYELGRFAGIGFSGVPIAQEVLPDTFSFYGEARAKIGSALTADVMAEYFTFGRTDVDASANLTVLGDWLSAQTRFTAVGLGQTPRYAVSLGARARLFKAFYLVGSGGTVFFAQANGSLNRGAFVSVGAGVDFER